tara:strand:+ start:672 stop:1190 length:519 start_codon:yes stop_codon:yes gene_type:complete
MNQKALKLLSHLMGRSETKLGLKAIDRLFKFGIPFNSPHKIKMRSISNELVAMELPLIRANKNHLGTMHACAIATVGEFCAGVLLIKNLDPSKYRVVMTNLDVTYLKHGASDLGARCEQTATTLSQAREQLQNSASTEITLETNIFNKTDEICAKVVTTWQLKNWNKVKKHR